jgi:hypothetical protein
MQRTVKLWDLSKPVKQRHHKQVGPYYMNQPAMPGTKGWEQTVGGGIGGYLKNDSLSEGSACRIRVKMAADIVNRRGTQWAFNEFSECYEAIVGILPSGRGFLAGATMGDGMSTFLETDQIYDNEKDAAMASKSVAESAANAQREYEERQRIEDEAGEAMDGLIESTH